MARKIEITKETMLQTAYEIVKEEGYAAVNIKTIATRIGCSTKPISWQFGNMPQMRKEIFKYASNRLYGGVEEKLSNMNALEAFFETGKITISNAIDNPNVYKFLCVDDPGDIVDGNKSINAHLGDEFIKRRLAKELNISEELSDRLVGDVVIYTHGLATMLLWNSIKIEKQTAFQMIFDQGVRCFSSYGIDINNYITKKD